MDEKIIRAILESGDFDQLKGIIEMHGVECKGIPYRLEGATQG